MSVTWDLIWVSSPLWSQIKEMILEWGQWFLFFSLWLLLLCLFAVIEQMYRLVSGAENENIRTVNIYKEKCAL